MRTVTDNDGIAPTGGFRIGLFGDTRSGKTVYLTALYWLARQGGLPEEVENIRAADGETERYLGDRVAMVDGGQWPPGNIDSTELRLLVDRKGGRTLTVKTADFRGGDFSKAFYSRDKDAARQFIRSLFRGCSAYLFLIDPAEIAPSDDASPTKEQQDERQRRLGGVIPALEILRRLSFRWRALHPPVAIVFTKSDRNPAAQDDPAKFAEQHANQIWRYLKTHAPSRHQIFAVSSTGPLNGNSNAPPAVLRPQHICTPIIECEKMYRQWQRTRRRLASAVIGVLILAASLALWFSNHQQIHLRREQIQTATTEELRTHYQATRQWQGVSRFALTHPWERQRLLAEIVDQAKDRAEGRWRSRLDDGRNIRTVRDYVEIDREIFEFAQHYPGTAAASSLVAWRDHQRSVLSAILVEDLKAAARRGDESVFVRLEAEYNRVATPRLDPEVQKGKAVLWETIGNDATKRLWAAWRISRNDVNAVRDRCREAEDAMALLPTSRRGDREFIALVRSAYDDLHRNGPIRPIGFKLEANSNRPVHWKVKIGGHEVATVNGWQTPVRTTIAKWYAVQGSFPLNVLDADSRVEIEMSTDNYGWGEWNGYGKKEYRLGELAEAIDRGDDWITTSRRDGYKLVFVPTNDTAALLVHLRRMSEIEDRGDALFRAPR